ncbi:Mor transcription activator family protein [Chitinimonas arctica]|nr:Mor transcription activator family protein [Chitinimonas arctica]
MTTTQDTLHADDARVSLLYDITAILREDIGLTEQLATPWALALVEGMCKRMGGEKRYIPGVDRTARDLAIRQEFNGQNRDLVCKKYGISRSRLYQIVSR